jgi:hypothetical protein
MMTHVVKAQITVRAIKTISPVSTRLSTARVLASVAQDPEAAVS